MVGARPATTGAGITACRRRQPASPCRAAVRVVRAATTPAATTALQRRATLVSPFRARAVAPRGFTPAATSVCLPDSTGASQGRSSQVVKPRATCPPRICIPTRRLPRHGLGATLRLRVLARLVTMLHACPSTAGMSPRVALACLRRDHAVAHRACFRTGGRMHAVTSFVPVVQQRQACRSAMSGTGA